MFFTKNPPNILSNFLITEFALTFYTARDIIEKNPKELFIMKLCFSTLGCTEKSLEEILAIAKSYSIPALEIRGIDNKMDNREIVDFLDANLSSTLSKFSAADVMPHVIGTSCTFHDEQRLPTSISEGKASIDIAAKLHVPYIRVFGNNIVGDRDECISRVISGIKELADYALNFGVTVLLEVHGDFNTKEALAPILDALGSHKAFGLIWDVMHSHRVYRSEWREFYEAIKPFIKHVHLKDIITESGELVLPGDGDIPLVPIVSTLLNDGYDGYLSLEWERKWRPELPEITVAIEALNAVLAKIR